MHRAAGIAQWKSTHLPCVRCRVQSPEPPIVLFTLVHLNVQVLVVGEVVLTCIVYRLFLKITVVVIHCYKTM